MRGAARNKTKFMPVAILRHGILYQDGHMVYTDGAGRWLYVSEDGARVYMYDNVADLIKELYKKSDNDDYVIAGWDMDPYRFTAFIGSAYNYYNAHFED